jgi:hypothetical protein
MAAPENIYRLYQFVNSVTFHQKKIIKRHFYVGLNEQQASRFGDVIVVLMPVRISLTSGGLNVSWSTCERRL